MSFSAVSLIKEPARGVSPLAGFFIHPLKHLGSMATSRFFRKVSSNHMESPSPKLGLAQYFDYPLRCLASGSPSCQYPVHVDVVENGKAKVVGARIGALIENYRD